MTDENWRLSPTSSDAVVRDCDCPDRDSDNDPHCHRHYGGHLVAESIDLLARQHQIVAAPELYRALKAMRLIQTEGYTRKVARALGLEGEFLIHGILALKRAVEQWADTAIAKAEGRS